MKNSLITGLLVLMMSSGYATTYEVYVSDAGNFENPPWQILRFDGDGTNPTVFIKDNLNWPQDIVFLDASSTVLISSLGSGRITKHDMATGVYLGDFATSIGGPTRMKIGPDNLLYVLQWVGNGRVRRYDLNGQFVGDFTSVGVPQSIGLDWDSSGNLYVSSYSQDYVRKFDASGKDLGLFISANLAGPTNLWFDGNGDLLLSDYDGAAVKRFDSAGRYLGDFIRGVRQAEGVDFFPDGDILIGDGGAHSVKRFDRGGSYLGDFVPPRAGMLLTPNAIVIRTLPDPVPLPPDMLAATVFGTSVVLTWRDNSDAEAGFRVYRGVDGGSRQAIADVGPDVTRFVDGTVGSGHTYVYWVAAFTTGGESDLSNSATASTPCASPAGEKRLRPLRRSDRPCTLGIVGRWNQSSTQNLPTFH